MDVTIFRFPDHTKAYIYLIIDNFSRAVLNWKVSSELKASISFENIREVFDRYGLHHLADVVELIVDDGSKNKKEVDAFVNLADSNVKKLVAQVDIVQSNSMVEAANKILKHQYLFPKDIQNLKQLCDGIAFYQEDFNNRPQGDLYGLNPLEVLSTGTLPHKSRFKEQIITARRKRVEQNQKFDCAKCPNPTESDTGN
ncbi:MAG: DDE-type integrase/transposase/recombinase [Flavobacteriales bacterium]|nr:DDE-type integrase/transposase/recombinase [Flavobacteriales bacterium]